MYRDLLFLQGEDAGAYLGILDSHGVAALVDHLAETGALNWDGELTDKARAGTADNVEQTGRYTVSWNNRLSYFGVEYFHFLNEVEGECVA